MHDGQQYRKLCVATAINAVVMFLITYALITEGRHFYVNINRIYMTLMMVAPMVLVMLLMMGSMYPDRRLNVVLSAASAGLFIVVFALARAQSLVGDEQFLRSMIPHHSSAILMCEEATISDPDIGALCEQIIRSQKREIAQMQVLLERY